MTEVIDCNESPKEAEKLTFVKFITNFILWIVYMLVAAYTLTQLWAWFVVPLGVVQITMPIAFGFGLIHSYFKMRGIKIFKPEVTVKQSFTKRMTGMTALHFVMLGVGYIATLFM